MKIRTGFVSNSSTTSFCIYGCGIDRKDRDKAEELDLEIYRCEDGSLCAGDSLVSIGENETRAEFKRRIEEKIKQINPEYKCDFIKESYYDG